MDDAIRPIVEELHQAWVDVASNILDKHRKVFDDAFPGKTLVLLSNALMNALPPLVYKCCNIVAADNQLPLAVTVVRQILSRALKEEEYQQRTLHELAGALRGALKRDNDNGESPSSNDNGGDTTKH